MAKISSGTLMIIGGLVIVISVIANGWSLLGPMTIFIIVGLGIIIWGFMRNYFDKYRKTSYTGDEEYDQMLAKREAEDLKPHDSPGLRATRDLITQQEQQQRGELQQQYASGLQGQQKDLPRRHIAQPPQGQQPQTHHPQQTQHQQHPQQHAQQPHPQHQAHPQHAKQQPQKPIFADRATKQHYNPQTKQYPMPEQPSLYKPSQKPAKYCMRCREQIDMKSKFCQHCGVQAQ